jgi:hypothetical protein
MEVVVNDEGEGLPSLHRSTRNGEGWTPRLGSRN